MVVPVVEFLKSGGKGKESLLGDLLLQFQPQVGCWFLDLVDSMDLEDWVDLVHSVHSVDSVDSVDLINLVNYQWQYW